MAIVKVDRLEIRLKGISPQVANSLTNGIGNEILKQLAAQRGLLANKRTVKISRIESGTFQTSRGQNPSDLQQTIASSIVQSIASKAK